MSAIENTSKDVLSALIRPDIQTVFSRIMLIFFVCSRKTFTFKSTLDNSVSIRQFLPHTIYYSKQAECIIIQSYWNVHVASHCSTLT